ncbi:MAG: MGMT family protein [Candidatus Erginobacter occultus]|nr:MGMT family protein [Candidatus Erginobacter occultus]
MPLPLKLKVIEDTPIGPVGIVWAEFRGGPRVVRVKIGDWETDLEPEIVSRPEIERVARGLREILEGKPAAVPLETAALEICPPFRQAVLRSAYRIPRGTVTSYGGLARSLGRAGAARAVGNALAANPFPLIVPCHRVVRSDGTIGGFTGGEGIKRRLLELEGVRFSDNGRMDR